MGPGGTAVTQEHGTERGHVSLRGWGGVLQAVRTPRFDARGTRPTEGSHELT